VGLQEPKPEPSLLAQGDGGMDSPFIVPLAVFVMVVLIVAITSLVKIREREMDVYQKLHLEEMEHRRKMEQLDLELKQLEQG
jgi:hypothetical protein